MRSATQPYCTTIEYGCVSLRMRFFPQNFGTIKRILPGSSSSSHREGPGIEVGCENRLKTNWSDILPVSYMTTVMKSERQLKKTVSVIYRPLSVMFCGKWWHGRLPITFYCS